MRLFFILLFLTPFVCLPTTGQTGEINIKEALEDRIIGNPTAPITIIEYASLTCPHCKTFHTDVLPSLKTAYIETGKVKFIFREFPLNALALRASMMARCAPTKQYYKFIGALFQTQSVWATNDEPLVALARVGKLGGMSQSDFDGCMQNEALFDGIMKSRQIASSKYLVESTPTFIVNGNKLEEAPTLEAFDLMIKSLVVDKNNPPSLNAQPKNLMEKAMETWRSFLKRLNL